MHVEITSNMKDMHVKYRVPKNSLRLKNELGLLVLAEASRKAWTKLGSQDFVKSNSKYERYCLQHSNLYNGYFVLESSVVIKENHFLLELGVLLLPSVLDSSIICDY